MRQKVRRKWREMRQKVRRRTGWFQKVVIWMKSSIGWKSCWRGLRVVVVAVAVACSLQG
jgi:hypothetical protein